LTVKRELYWTDMGQNKNLPTIRAEDGDSTFLRNVRIYLYVPHGVTTQKTDIYNITAMRTSNLTKIIQIPAEVLLLFVDFLNSVCVQTHVRYRKC
jgi:hypothetical protein